MLQSRHHLVAPHAGDPRARKGALYLRFLESPGTERDPTPHAREPDDLHNPDDVPGRAVRKQTADLIMLLEAAQHLAHYYLFLEDDFRCAACSQMTASASHSYVAHAAGLQTRPC